MNAPHAPWQVLLDGRPTVPEILFGGWPDDLYERRPLHCVRLTGTAPVRLKVESPIGGWRAHWVPGCDVAPDGPGWIVGPGAKMLFHGAAATLVVAHRGGPPRLAERTLRTTAELGLEPHSWNLQTAVLQAALDRMAADGGGTFVLGPGLWRSGTLEVGPRTTLQLAEGAVLRGSDDLEDYPLDPRVDTRTNGRAAAARALIRLRGAHGAALLGPGRLDGNGRRLRRGVGGDSGRLAPVINLVRAEGCRGLRLTSLELVDPPFWNTHLVDCEDVSMRDLLVLNEVPPPGWVRSARHPGLHFIWNNTDGIVPDSCRRLTLEDFLAHCGDDCVPVKSTGCLGFPPPPSGNLRVRQGVLLTPVTAIKLGTETNGGPVCDLVFEDLVVASCARAIGLDLRDDAAASGLVFRRIDVNACNRWFDVQVDPRTSATRPGKLADLTFEDLSLPSRTGPADPSTIRGAGPGAEVTGLRFKGLRVGGQPQATLPADEVRLGLHAAPPTVEP